jgi:acetoin utilization deacetylase AcuC-like enzyme
MIIINEPQCLGYASSGHPERPQRVGLTVERLKDQQDLSLKWRQPIEPERRSLLRAHTAAHLERLQLPQDFDADTAFHPGIADRAKASAGAALLALQLARGGETAFSLMRPPGHHATRNQAMGFCYLNSIAIAVLEALSSGVKKIAIYDFDVHHGNGTEAILAGQAGAAFFSVHQFPCYPGTGTVDVGGNCFNFPVPPYMPRESYRRTLEIALGKLKQFGPEIVAVSAGFDAYARDPLAQGTLEVEDYYWLGQQIRGLGVPVLNILEGGYSDDLPELIFAYLRGLENK